MQRVLHYYEFFYDALNAVRELGCQKGFVAEPMDEASAPWGLIFQNVPEYLWAKVQGYCSRREIVVWQQQIFRNFLALMSAVVLITF